MGYIPGGREVERSLKQAQKEMKSALKQINVHAANLLGKGDYDGAEDLIAAAKNVDEFEAEFGNIIKRWREMAGGKSRSGEQKEKALALWEYYVPTLETMVALGGTATKDGIEQEIEPKAADIFPPSELAIKGKKPRWAQMMRRALKAMEKEGFVERIKSEWRITSAGKKAFENSEKEVQS